MLLREYVQANMPAVPGRVDRATVKQVRYYTNGEIHQPHLLSRSKTIEVIPLGPRLGSRCLCISRNA